MVLLAVAAGLLWVSRRPPVINEIDPDRVSPGDSVALVGRNFGREGRLEIDGIALERSVVRSWNENLVIFEMPGDLRSGMVRVQTENGMSNPVFLTNRADLPKLVSEQRLRVRTVSRREAAPGSVVTVQGDGFGPRSPGSRLGFHYPESGDVLSFPGDRWWISRWTNRQLHFVVPPDLPPGPVRIVINDEVLETDLTILAPTATVTYGDPQAYRVRQSVQLQNTGGRDPVYVLVPRIPDLPAQPRVSLLEEFGTPVDRDTPAAWVYRPAPEAESEDSSTGAAVDGGSEEQPPVTYRVVRTDLVERRSERWTITAVAPVATLLEPEFQRAFLLFLSDGDGVPVYDSAVGEIRRASINLRNTPLVIARTIHREVQRRLDPDREGVDVISSALAGEPASAGAYADLATALLRVSGLPARRHFGLLIADDDTAQDHSWVEVFLPGVGWVPMDPALGDGMYGDRFSGTLDFYGDDIAADTFGALDDRRITAYVDGIANSPLYSRSGVLLPDDPGYAPGVLRVEGERPDTVENLDVTWERPRIGGSGSPTETLN